MANTRLSRRGERFATALRGRRGRRVPLLDLWAVLDRVDPASRTDPNRRIILADLLAELAESEQVTLPSTRSYERSEHPPLPKFVTLPVTGEASAPRRQIVWHPTLSWVPESRVSPSQHDRLVEVNAWLHSTPNPLPVPHRERSLEIFGDEKVLDRLLATGMFGPGRLTLELLATYRATVRFTSELVGEGDILLVVENSDTFDSLVHALRSRSDHRVSLVAWGAGGAFEASVLSIARLDRAVNDVAYFGDVDAKGIKIPANAASLAAQHGLPTIRPAIGLYTALLDRGRRRSGQKPVSPEVAEGLVRWLPPEHRDAVKSCLASGVRLAQEAVGRDYLTTEETWLSDLR